MKESEIGIYRSVEVNNEKNIPYNFHVFINCAFGAGVSSLFEPRCLQIILGAPDALDPSRVPPRCP